MYVVLCILVTALPVLCTVLDLKDYNKNDKARPTFARHEFPDLMDQPFFKNEKTQTTPRRTIMTRLFVDISSTGPAGSELVNYDSTEAVNTNSFETVTGELKYDDPVELEGHVKVADEPPPPVLPAGQEKESTISENVMLPPSDELDALGATDKQEATPITGDAETTTTTDNNEVIPAAESSSPAPEASSNISISNHLNETFMEIFTKMAKGPCSQLIRYPPDPDQVCLTMEFIMTENRHYAAIEDMCTRIQIESFPALLDGRPTEKAEVTYQIAIRRKVGNVFEKHCSGALVTSRFVLTAAICVTDISTFSEYHVVGGPSALDMSNDDQLNSQFWRQICCYYVHKYLPHVYYRDIAVLEVSKPFKLSASLSPIKIQGIPRQENQLAVNTANRCMLTKYTNRLKSSTDKTPEETTERLHLACAPILDHEACAVQFRVIFGMRLNNATDFCVGTAALSVNCYGEPGSPLVCGGALVGVATSVHVCGKSPGLFTQLPGSILRMTLLADAASAAPAAPAAPTATAPALYAHILLLYPLITL